MSTITRTGRDVESRPQADGAGRGRTRQRSGVWFCVPFLVVYAAFLIYPMLLGVRMSLFNWSLTGIGTDQFLGLGNYREMLGDEAVWLSLWNTALFTLMSTPPLVGIALLMALLTNRAMRFRWIYRLAYFAPYVLPVSVVTLIWTWLYQPGFGLINGTLTALGFSEIEWLTDSQWAMLAVVIATVWWTVGFNYLLYLAGLQDIPEELYEAADLDGAGAFARLRDITLPLLKRTTGLVLVLQVLASLKIFDQVYLMTEGGPNFATRPIIQYIYESGFTNYRIGYASAVSYMFFAVIVVVSILQFKLFARRQEQR
ncbi:MAG TPA: sugar ABC transporter permease [Nocardioidaceae bacterium]|nr:sugar ABC transporter permease [Nocardioidaceae bacterium]